jgi:hypothetical protein
MQIEELTADQIREWAENPVTLVLKGIAEYERNSTYQAIGVDCYHVYEPQKTQEILANLNGAVDTWDIVIAALDGEGLLNIEEDEYAEFE